ncbi:TonB-dependent receptor [Tenacibaculum caenipelagi]|uniref:Outer membrane receptor for ferrienterochelin and colicin n=1 Tax=Tenacibaculum caenipelagi TaxID=1325435 RepID=A0A4R6TDF8_9FLAO|nr:TonB-dependent receptor [Tenacibaculum caenipelagi]TDQ27747.1 outer membrane receptor for ferrienterochelin and colicin [Tenacibaculum caenipelagi]
MKKLLFLVFVIFLTTSYAQEKITVNLNNTNLKEAILLIEQDTNYQFYYLDSWLNTSQTIKEDFKNSTIETILNSIFKNSDINYYVIENNKIILTKNNKIHDSNYTYTLTEYTSIENTPIQKDSLIEVKKEVIKPSSTPVFTSREPIKIKTIKIGKEGNTYHSKYTLSGFVKSSITGKPIENLLIINKAKSIYTYTNEKGYYSINLPYGVNIIDAIIPGALTYKTRIILLGNGTHNFNLTETSEQLNEVIIQSNGKKNIKSSITGITQIKAEDIKTIPQVLGERDILKVATTLPGIKNAGEGSDGVNVRGGKSDQNLFLIDKSTLYNPTHFLGLFSAVNPFTTKDLKVYKGNIPAEFGGRISSVFDITTKDANTKKIAGEASIGPVTSNISLELPIIKEKSGLLLGGRSTYSDWLLKALDDNKLKNSSASFFDIMGKYSHKFNDNNTITASGYYSQDKYSIASDTTNTYGNKILSLNWFHKFNDKTSGNLLLSNSSYFFDIDSETNTNKDFVLKYKINEYNLKLNMKYLLSKKHLFNYGIDSKLYKINPGDITPKGSKSIITPFSVQQEKALESSIFISDDFSPSKKLSFNAGARYTIFNALGKSSQRIYDPNSPLSDASVIGYKEYKNNEIYKTYHGLSLRFSSRYSFTDDFSVKASLSNGYQFIHRLTNNTSASPTDTWKLSDSNIKPQEAIQTSLGFHRNLKDDIYELSIEGYYKKFRNILDYKVGASFLLNEYIETEVLQGPGESYGIEFLAKKNIGRLNGWLSYTYSRSFLRLDSKYPEEIVNNGKPFPTNFDKPHDLSIIANYKLTKRFSLSGNFSYQTGRPITYPTGKYIYQGNEYLLYSDRNEYRIPDYYRLDIGVNIEGNHKLKKLAHSFWNVSIYNVLGRNNPYAIYFVTKDGKAQAYQSSIFSKPIPTITYNIKF